MTCTASAFDDPHDFAAVVEPLVTADPAGTTVLATVLADVLGGVTSYPGATWVAVEEDGRVVGAAMRTPPHRLWLSPMPEAAAVAVAELVAGRLAADDRPGMTGERDAVAAAARRWTALRPDDELSEVRALRLFALEELHAPPAVTGGARLATLDDVDLLLSWYQAFAEEAHLLLVDARQTVAARLDGHGTLVLWHDGGAPVSLAGHSAVVSGSVRVGPVYTPPGRRGRGYGSAVTAAATQRALDQGVRKVVLFTDLANPTSNAIYARLGYRPVRDYVELAAR